MSRNVKKRFDRKNQGNTENFINCQTVIEGIKKEFFISSYIFNNYNLFYSSEFFDFFHFPQTPLTV